MVFDGCDRIRTRRAFGDRPPPRSKALARASSSSGAMERAEPDRLRFQRFFIFIVLMFYRFLCLSFFMFYRFFRFYRFFMFHRFLCLLFLMFYRFFMFYRFLCFVVSYVLSFFIFIVLPRYRSNEQETKTFRVSHGDARVQTFRRSIRASRRELFQR